MSSCRSEAAIDNDFQTPLGTGVLGRWYDRVQLVLCSSLSPLTRGAFSTVEECCNTRLEIGVVLLEQRGVSFDCYFNLACHELSMLLDLCIVPPLLQFGWCPSTGLSWRHLTGGSAPLSRHSACLVEQCVFVWNCESFWPTCRSPHRLYQRAGLH